MATLDEGGEDKSPAAVPTYRIFRDQHGIPQFSPKRGTQALKDALIYSFPAFETELQLMQAALKAFFDSERSGTSFVCELPENNLQASLAKRKEVPVSPKAIDGKLCLRNWKVDFGRGGRTSSRTSSRASSRAPSRASSRAETPTGNARGSMSTWVLANGQELEKRKRQPYDPAKRRKVAENRGNACEKHRASKTTCDPSLCPQNKLFSKPGSSTTGEGASLDVFLTPATSEQMTLNDMATAASCNTLLAAQPSSETDVHAFWHAWEPTPLGEPTLDPVLGGNNFSSPISWAGSAPVDPLPWNPLSYQSPALDCVIESETFIQEAGAVAKGDTKDVFFNSIGPKDNVAQTTVTEVLDTSLSPYSSKHLPSNASLFHSIHRNDDQMGDTLAETSDNSVTIYPSTQPTPNSSFGEDTTFWSSSEHLAISQCSDDPFMGWATKRASHIFEDYTWVLSHVETL